MAAWDVAFGEVGAVRAGWSIGMEVGGWLVVGVWGLGSTTIIMGVGLGMDQDGWGYW